MNPVTIEFFHDVICSYCFPMSYRMRKLQQMHPEVQIVHRSFALSKSEQDFNLMFGSRAAAKDEVLGHWEHANQNDDLHRFNIAGMRTESFPFPTSMKPLTACKAAFFTAGEAGYWNVFDALQKALFVQSRNIEDDAVINDCVRESGIDFDLWEQHFKSAATTEAVEKDFLLANQYRIQGVPCLIIDGKYRVSGAQPLEQILNAVTKAAEAQEQSADPADGAACRLEDGSIKCD